MANPDALHADREAINPYRLAYSMVKARLAWDLNPLSWSSRRKIALWKDRFKGEKAVILCNGPSLLKSDLSLLGDVFTFGLNKINLMFDQNDFRPSCIVAVNKLVLEQNVDFYNETDSPLFLDSAAASVGVKFGDNTHLLHATNQRKFARDCSISVYQGYTVTYVALQLAFHMGFKEVALIGADHYFSAKGKPNQTVSADDVDADHFDPRYFSKGVQWQLPDIAESELSYIMARDVFDSFGRKVVNATAGGFLDVFDRVSLEAFVRS